MEIKRSLYILTEGPIDAQIIEELLDCSEYDKVYRVPAEGYGSLSSVARTIRLMKDSNKSNDKIVIVFDSDSEIQEVTDEKIAMMQYLTNATYDKRIGVFCFQPNIDMCLFGEPQFSKKAVRKNIFRKYIDSHKTELQTKDIIVDIQKFLNK